MLDAGPLIEHLESSIENLCWIRMDKLRLFIAIEIPAEVRRRLAEIEKELMASDADVKWVPEGNFHATLKFLGYVDEDRVEQVSRAVESAAKDSSAFEAALSGVGAFPNPRRPSVVWVGITSGVEEMKALAAKVEDALEPLGFAREERPFSAHITLGRTRSPRNADKLREIIERLREENAGRFEVEGVALMKSDLRPTGPVYSQIADCGLRIAD